MSSGCGTAAEYTRRRSRSCQLDFCLLLHVPQGELAYRINRAVPGKKRPFTPLAVSGQKGGNVVKKDGQTPVVHCFFTEEGKKLPELIVELLRLFVMKSLCNAEKI